MKQTLLIVIIFMILIAGCDNSQSPESTVADLTITVSIPKNAPVDSMAIFLQAAEDSLVFKYGKKEIYREQYDQSYDQLVVPSYFYSTAYSVLSIDCFYQNKRQPGCSISNDSFSSDKQNNTSYEKNQSTLDSLEAAIQDNFIQPVTNDPSIVITGDPVFGQQLSVPTVCGNSSNSRYLWYKDTDTSGYDGELVYANGSTYTIATSDINNYLYVLVNCDGSGNSYSASHYTEKIYSNETIVVYDNRFTDWSPGPNQSIVTDIDSIFINKWPRQPSSSNNCPDYLVKVISFGDVQNSDFSHGFDGCKNLLEVPPDIPSTVRATSYLFANVEKCDFDIGNWNTTNIENMDRMFLNSPLCNPDIGYWDVSHVSTMYEMFKDASSFNQDISNWDVSRVKNMRLMFANSTAFNQNVGNWNVSNVTEMDGMFANTTAFNQNIGDWNVSNVTSMWGMFRDAIAFNQSIDDWNVSNVENMNVMFKGATAFNQDIGGWDVSNVKYMNNMFQGATSFNQDISNWDVSYVHQMDSMFAGATSFNQDISNWNIKELRSTDGMFAGVTIPTEIYSRMLIQWSKLKMNTGISHYIDFDAGNSKYSSDAAAARQRLIDEYRWKIRDAGMVD